MLISVLFSMMETAEYFLLNFAAWPCAQPNLSSAEDEYRLAFAAVCFRGTRLSGDTDRGEGAGRAESKGRRAKRGKSEICMMGVWS